MMGALQGTERIMYYMYLFSITDHNKKALRSPVCVRCTDSVELRLAAAAALAFALGDLASASRKKW